MTSIRTENRIDKLGNMIWSQLSTKVLQITILDNKDSDKNKCQYSKENSSLEQRIFLHNQMHDFNQNTS